jgi:hypothetical protein
VSSSSSRCQLNGAADVTAARAGTRNGHAGWLDEVARSAGRDTGAPVELLGDYLLVLADAAMSGREPRPAELEAVGRLFIEDLLRGDADVGRLVERAEPFGLDMARPHQVALAAPTGRLADATPAISSLEHAVVRRLGDRDVLVATKDGLIVVVAPTDSEVPRPSAGAPRSATSSSPHSAAWPADGRGASRSGGPTPAPTGSPAPTRRPAKVSRWPRDCAWTRL